jgi:hypothetical protein
MIARTFKAKALVFAIFFLGIGSGILIANFYTTRVTSSPDAVNPPDNAQRTQRAQRDINKFYDYLGVDPSQREQIHLIGEETRREFQELRRETNPRFQAIKERSRVKIRAILNNEQRAKYDEFLRKLDEERKNRRREFKDGDGEPSSPGAQRSK